MFPQIIGFYFSYITKYHCVVYRGMLKDCLGKTYRILSLFMHLIKQCYCIYVTFPPLVIFFPHDFHCYHSNNSPFLVQGFSSHFLSFYLNFSLTEFFIFWVAVLSEWYLQLNHSMVILDKNISNIKVLLLYITI